MVDREKRIKHAKQTKPTTRGSPAKRPRGRPRLNRKLWMSRIRLPEQMGKRLAKAAKDHHCSINAAIEAVIGAWLYPPDETVPTEATEV